MGKIPGLSESYPSSPLLVGAIVGALAGLIARIALLMPFLKELGGSEAVMLGFVSGVIGLVIGGTAGLTGRLVMGAIVGAALSALISVGTFWLGILFISPTPSFVSLVIGGAVAGGIGGASAQAAARRRLR